VGLITKRDDFDQLFVSFDHTAFRFEVRDRYDVATERESVERFIATGSRERDPASRREWLGLIAAASAQGKRFMRVRCVTVPLSDYARFGLAGAIDNNAAGEDIRYMERSRYNELGLPNSDVWMFDSARLAVLHFGDDDKLRATEIVTDPVVVQQHCQWRDAAWHYAIPRDEFAATHGSELAAR
jgi:hypothetical protein